jgi:hypothetical protein
MARDGVATVFVLQGAVGAIVGSFGQGFIGAGEQLPYGLVAGACAGFLLFWILRITGFRLPFAPGWLPAILAFLCWVVVLALTYVFSWADISRRGLSEALALFAYASYKLPLFVVLSYLLNLVGFAIIKSVGLSWPTEDSWRRR